MKSTFNKSSIALLAAVALFLFTGLAIAAPQEGVVQDSQYQNLGIDFLTTQSQGFELKNGADYPQMQNGGVNKPQVKAAPPNGQQVEPPCTKVCVDGACGTDGQISWGYCYCAEWSQEQIDAVAEQALEDNCPVDEPPAEDPPAEEPPAGDPPAGDPPVVDPPADPQPALSTSKLPNTGSEMAVYAVIAVIIAATALAARRYASKKTS